ncbi:MAG: hypothetical protein ABSD20_06380 [Terriglobales bacterium]|jgi:hypothetical protein
MNTSAQQNIAGYWRQTPLSAPPDFMIPRGEARRLQAEQKGVLLNHGRAFRRWADSAEDDVAHYRLRDASCSMNDRIIEANANGDLRAVAITEGWRGTDGGTWGPGDSAT